MVAGPLTRAIQDIRRWAGVPGAGELADRQLLDRFVAHTDGAAFEALVRRHGPLVWGVCRRVLANDQDAEDAFQATFVVLARKATSLGQRERVGSWLYGVACRTASKARVERARRQRHESAAGAAMPIVEHEQPDWRELSAVLDTELERLPEHYRLPILLCHLDGKSREEAAEELGWSPGMVKGRLERGRELLRRRLARRGVTFSAAVLATLLGQDLVRAMPAPLVHVTVQSITAGAAAPVAVLAQGVLQTMFWTKMKWIAVCAFTIALFATGAGWLVYEASALATPLPKREVKDPGKPNLTPKAAQRRQQLQKELDQFALSLYYDGAEDKPFYRLTLSVPVVPRLAIDPFHPIVQINHQQAARIVEHLAKDGFLDRAGTVIVKPRNTAYYALHVRTGGDALLFENLGLDLATLHRLDDLRTVLDGDAAKAMDLLINRLSGMRMLWLIDDMNSGEGSKRVAATKELFRLGKQALPELKKAGAKQIAPVGGTVDGTRRLDMVYSLIEGLPPNPPQALAGYKTDSFGLHFERGVAREEVVRLGEKHGFVLEGKYDPNSRPNCYVKIADSKVLDEVLEEILTSEPKVKMINLNYFER